MRIALLADIHANREALDAVLAALPTRGVERIVLLGDMIGYGADPVYCTEKAMELVEAGALAVLGNHDAALEEAKPDMNGMAMAALDWTRGQLQPAHRAFLAALPLSVEEEDRLYVHASARVPRAWDYVSGANAAERCIRAASARLIFVGHVHVPCLWRLTSAGTASAHQPEAGIANPLARSQRWLGVIGAVGQPRDGSPAAAFAIHDTERHTLTYERVAYDHFTAARKVREAGLPPALSERLLRGR